MNHDDDTIAQYQLPPLPGWQHQIHASLDPYYREDDHTIDLTEAVTTAAARPPRYEQIVKTAALLAGMVDVWQARGQLANLDSYLARRVDGEPHPLAWSRHYRQYNDVVQDAATMLIHGGPS